MALKRREKAQLRRAVRQLTAECLDENPEATDAEIQAHVVEGLADMGIGADSAKFDLATIIAMISMAKKLWEIIEAWRS